MVSYAKIWHATSCIFITIQQNMNCHSHVQFASQSNYLHFFHLLGNDYIFSFTWYLHRLIVWIFAFPRWLSREIVLSLPNTLTSLPSYSGHLITSFLLLGFELNREHVTYVILPTTCQIKECVQFANPPRLHLHFYWQVFIFKCFTVLYGRQKQVVAIFHLSRIHMLMCMWECYVSRLQAAWPGCIIILVKEKL